MTKNFSKSMWVLAVFALYLFPAFGQSPNSMSYQAVIRNSSDALVTNTQIGMEINIRQGSVSGTVVYTETQTPTTNANGLVSIEIGSGADFTTIDWAAGPYFMETKTDPTGGTNYTLTGTSQLLSVPYALHAKTAETVTGGIIETDPVFNASVASGITATDTANWNKNSGNYIETDPVFNASVASGITATDTANWNKKLDSYTETDPVFAASVASGITGTDTANWNKKLDSYTETDPIFTAWDKDYSDLTNKPNIKDTVTTYGFNGNYQSLTNKPNLKDTVATYAVTKTYVDELKIMILDLQAELGVTDTRDGIHYKAVRIGNQVWMAENLKYLPSVVGPATGSDTIPYYYVYDYNGTHVDSAKATSNYATYGVLYNWTAAMDGAASSTANPSGVQGVCPAGWHLPSDAEWTALENYLIANGYNYDGTITGNKIAKAMAATTGWNSSSITGAVGNTDYPAYQNKSGFTALPGGNRHDHRTFYEIGNEGYWWSATEDGTSNAWNRYLYYTNNTGDKSYYNKEFGYSVRCVKD